MQGDGSATRRRMRRKLALRIGIVLFWLLAMGWLVRFEAFPEYFTHKLEGYHSLLSDKMLMSDSWMRILFNGEPIGYSHTRLDTDDKDPLNHCTIENRVNIQLKMLGKQQRIQLNSSAIIDVTDRLQRFSLDFSARGYSMRMKAVRRIGEEFSVVTTTGNSKQRMTVDIPDDVILYSPMTEMALKRLKPGDELSLRTIDPVTMSIATMTVKALRKESLTIDDTSYDATVLSTAYQGVDVVSWIDIEGRVLRQDTPFGWVMERCTALQAREALRDAGQAEDILYGMAVRLVGKLRHPREAHALRLKLSGVTFEPGELATPRQEVVSIHDDETELLLRADRLPAGQWDGAVQLENPDLFLAPSQGVQSDHPDIMERAIQIAGSQDDPVEKARAIYEWVHKNVRKSITISLPSALDVLRTMEGDCNEHTTLYVALARAAGRPAAVKVGLAYQEGRFFYHAWPAVYVGRWLEMDPTWGQPAVDATHIALAEGDLADQLRLIKVMGKLRIEVLSEETGDGQRRVDE